MAPGDLLRLEAGCDKRLETCRLKFDNVVNFRGFPHIPGEDWLIGGAGEPAGERRRQPVAAATMTARRIVALARGWIGTPYVHQASCRGAGADCLGLIRGVWRELIGAEPEAVPAYRADWSEAARDERLWAGGAAASGARAKGWRRAAVVLFRMRDRGVAKHLGIVSAAAEPRRRSSMPIPGMASSRAR